LNFKEALVYSDDKEDQFLDRLKNYYPFAMKIPGAFKQYDFFVPGSDIKIELKTDIISNKTGNFVIETFHYGKPSGITTTTADYWVFDDGDSYYWITPAEIKDIILIHGIRQSRFIGEGDAVEKRAYLVSKGLIIKKSCTKWTINACV